MANGGADIATSRKPRSAGDRLVLALFALAIMVGLVVPFFSDPVDTSAPRLRGGVADYSGYRPFDRPVELAGEWRVTWLGPGAATGETGLVRVPGQWTGARVGDGTALPARGRARYDAVLRGVPAGEYSIHLPLIWGAVRATVDGRPVAARGAIGDGPATTRYDLRAIDLRIRSTGDDIRLGLEMASFLHRENGLEDPPVFGAPEPMSKWTALKWSRELLYNVSLLLIASLGIAVFMFGPENRASLYFGLSCLAFLPTASILGFENLLQVMLPWLDFRTSTAIQYLSGVVAAMFFFANAHELFPDESPRWIARAIMIGFAATFIVHLVYAITGDTLAASLFQRRVFLNLAIFTLVYMLVIIVRAVRHRRDGSFVVLLGMGMFVGTFLVGVSVSSGYLRSDQVPGYEYTTFGVIMLLYSHVVLMAERWSHSIARTKQINADLRQLLEVNTAITSDLQLGSLLEKIVEVTSRIIHADRSSLFLKDKDNPILESLVAQGLADQRIRFDVGRGIAGYVHATGEIVNIPDAYADERFNRSIDQETGYRTRTILTVPITARDGRRLGVMQALNRRDGLPFSDDDAKRMAAFGAQAAVAIDNARLFGEAVSARNFDESILRSMAGGVIALDLEWRITKLNAAAAEILGAPASLLMGLDARALLGQHNPWLVDELAAVAVQGEPKLMLDLELATARDRPSSVNLSIVPLQGEGGKVGVLMVIEDISEEKRLQGAMRRFMTQEVVDQVLGRDDELLFGTACVASVLFADVRGFTTLAENLTARETVETLNELFTELFEAVAGHEGVLDKYIGDAVMAVYGAPLPTGRDPQNAVASGIEMLQLLDKINAARAGRGLEPLRLGIGISTGEVVAGTVGSPKRMDYTVIGDSVNLAARLQDLTKVYGVEMLVCQATATAIAGDRPLREIDLIAVRGRRRPETVFEVLARAPADPAAHAALLESYAAGRAALIGRDWDAALAAFSAALEIAPDDRPSRLMLARTRALAGRPPSELWDGVWRDPHAAAA